MNKMKEKLKSRTGETITEVLVALLISTFALLMLAMMIRSAQNSVDMSRKALEDYYSLTVGSGSTVAVDVKLKQKAEDEDTKALATYEYDGLPSASKTLGGKDVITYTQKTEGGTT